MKTLTLQECKDAVARKYGYTGWCMKIHENGDHFVEKMWTEVSELYATQQFRSTPLNEGEIRQVPDWAFEKDGVIDVPDDLMPLFNKVGTQLRFHTISGKSEVETVAHILWNAQKFFAENPDSIYSPSPTVEQNKIEE
jgi:hypothetical protein